MKNSDLNVDGPVKVHVQDGKVVVKGSSAEQRGRLIGEARIKPDNGTLEIEAKGSLVLTLPRNTDLALSGTINDAVFKGMNAVTMEECHGNLSAEDGGMLEIEDGVHGNVALRGLSADFTAHEVMGDLLAKQCKNVQAEEVHGNLVLKQIENLFIGSDIMGNLSMKHGQGVRASEVHGNVYLKQVTNVHIQEIQGNLSASEVSSDNKNEFAIQVAEVGGNVDLKQSQNVHIENIAGNLEAFEVRTHQENELAILVSEVGGNVNLKQVDDVQIREIQGNLTAFDTGAILLDTVEGNATLKNISGEISLNLVEGNLVVDTPGRSLVAGNVEGHVELTGKVQPGGEYIIHADGNVTAMLQGNVYFIIRTEGKLELGEGLERENAEQEVYVYQGSRENAAQVIIQGEGDVCINTDHCHKKRRPRNKHDRHSNWHHEKKVGPDINIEEEIRQAMDEVFTEVKRASRTMRNEFERAFNDVDQTTSAPIGDFIRHAVQDLFTGLRREAPAPPEPEEPVNRSSAPNPSGEEIKTILRMVQNGTITAEEAERLIQAMQ